MKINKILYFCIALSLTAFVACSELEDKEHYKELGTEILSDELLVVNATSEEFLASAEEYSQMNELFKTEGIYDELKAKGQLSTLLVVMNSDYKQPEGTEEEVQKVTRAHVSDVAISPANLKTNDNSMRIMMWHGKYINVDLDDAAMNEGKIVNHIMFNTSAVHKVIKTNSGYIYVISDMIDTPQSLNDYIEALNDNYSIFRDTIKASGGKIFDKANSKAIGVNSEGNTIYDTVWIYTNKHFDEKSFDLNSESLTATLLVPSNKVIEEAIADAEARLKKWGLWDTWTSDRQYDFKYTMCHWIMDVAFFNQKYTADQLQNSDEMLSSIFSKDWKPSAQEIYPEVTELSNGLAYQIKKLYIPNNVLIYRLKEEFNAYEECTAENKEEFFKMNNIVFSKISTDVAAWTPLTNVWPMHENRIMECVAGEESLGEWTLDFTPCRRIYGKWYTWKEKVKNLQTTNGIGVEKVVPFLIPPGTYRLAFGSKQNVGLNITFSIFAEGIAAPLATSEEITLGSATNYHYDRGNTLPDRYPEWYDVSYEGNSSKAGNYDTDGGPVIDSFVVPDVKGDGSPVRLMFRISCPSWAGKTKMIFNHWCLRPTKDNY